MSVLNKETYTLAQADLSDFPIDSAREKTEKELVSILKNTFNNLRKRTQTYFLIFKKSI